MSSYKIYTSEINILGSDGGTVVGTIHGKEGKINIDGIIGDTGAKGDTGLSGDRYNTSTTASVIITPSSGTVNLTVDKDLAYIPGNSVVVVNITSSTIKFEGTVSSYTKSSGAMTINNIKNISSGSFTSSAKYNVNLDGVDGPAGPTGPAGPDGLYNSDNWIFKNLLDQPPAPGYTGVTGPVTMLNVNVIKNATTIGFWVQNPEQFAYGSMLVPFINSVKLTVGNSTPGWLDVFTDDTTYVPDKSPIKAIVLSKTASSGYVSNYNFGGSFGTRPTYVYGKSDLGNYAVSGKIRVKLSYKNDININPVNEMVIDLQTFLDAFPPSVVRTVTFTLPTTVGGTLGWIDPLYTNNDATPDNTAVLENYKIDYYSNSSPQRYTGYTTHSNSLTAAGTANSYIINTMKPGTQYDIYVSAKNTTNANYGPSGTIQNILTSLPVPKVIPSSLTLALPVTQYYNVANGVKLVSNNIVISDPIYIKGNAVGNCNTITTDLPIHTSANPGSAALNLSNIKFNINGVTQSTVNFHGFGSTFTENNITNSKAGFIGQTIADAYSGDSSEFFEYVNAITPRLTLTNGTTFAASGSVVTGQVIYSVSSSTVSSNVDNFYVDDLIGGPTGTATYNSNTISTYNVTGITVVGNSTGTFTYNVAAYNIGKYFYRADKIIELTTTTPGVTLTNNTITAPPNTTSPIPSPSTFSNKVANISFTDASVAYGITISPSVYNYHSTAGSAAACATITIPVIFDFKTANKTLRTIQNIGGATDYFGARIKVNSSLNGTNNGDFTTTYTSFDNNQSLIVSPYTNELPVISGQYTTPEYNTDYFDGINGAGGINYTSLNSETGMRYSSFAWNILKTYNGSLSNLDFTFTGFNHNSNLSYDTTSSSIITNSRYEFYYRIEQYDINKIYYPGELINGGGTENYSTVWINANSALISASFNTNSKTPASNKTVPGLTSTNASTLGITQNLSYTVGCPSLNPNNMTHNLRIFVIIGIKMDRNINFTDIKCKYN